MLGQFQYAVPRVPPAGAGASPARFALGVIAEGLIQQPAKTSNIKISLKTTSVDRNVHKNKFSLIN